MTLVSWLALKIKQNWKKKSQVSHTVISTLADVFILGLIGEKKEQINFLSSSASSSALPRGRQAPQNNLWPAIQGRTKCLLKYTENKLTPISGLLYLLSKKSVFVEIHITKPEIHLLGYICQHLFHSWPLLLLSFLFLLSAFLFHGFVSRCFSLHSCHPVQSDINTILRIQKSYFKE